MTVSECVSLNRNNFLVLCMDATDINALAREFLAHYYSYLIKFPEKIQHLYTDDAVMVRGNGTYQGRKVIFEKLMKDDFSDCRVGISDLNALKSNANSILIQVG